MSGLKLDKECQLIIECRSLLTSYDDFMLGLKMNQALYEAQEKSYQMKVAALQEGFDQKLKLLMLAADRAGLIPALTAEMNRLSGDGTELLESSTAIEV
jgi:hypothetical protein